MRAVTRLICAVALDIAFVGGARAGDEAWRPLDLPSWASFHGQFTLVDQFYPSFHSPFEGANSLAGHSQSKETTDATLFVGARLSDHLEIYANPEIDQGFGLSNTLGVAGFTSGEAYKVGRSNPYFRLPRAFARYTIDLGGSETKLDDSANQVTGSRTADAVVITVGKFSTVDIFDTNAYAHDPRADFLNWAIVDSGAYDYAADAWGYTYGAAVEWTQSWWTLRTGLFDLSTIPNTTALDTGFQQFELVAEAEVRHDLFAQPGKVKILGFANRGRMGSYDAAVDLAARTEEIPDTGLVRRYRTRPGAALNVEQGITSTIGAFLRLSANDGSKEAYEFTEINRSVASGVSVTGATWGRKGDTFGLALVASEISAAARRYLAAGGLGILIGDGQLPSVRPEKIIETYYKAEIIGGIAMSFDYQHIANPAYDAARGPANVFAVRAHAEFRTDIVPFTRSRTSQ